MQPPPHRSIRNRTVLIIAALFLLPLAARAVQFAFSDAPRSWRDADWSSTGSLPAAAAYPEARVLVFTGRAGGWKGVFAVHSWVVYKRAGAPGWTRYDVVGWGNPVRRNNWAPDGRWYGSSPAVIADIKGDAAEKLIPKIEASIRSYTFANYGDYRIWPGPNSNTFVAAVLRAIPDMQVTLPPNAIGRDYRAQVYFGPSDSGTGIEASLYGVLGLKIGWVEGIEFNMLGLIVGFDLRRPALKLPGFGLIGVDAETAVAGHVTAR